MTSTKLDGNGEISFGRFRLDLRRRELSHDGRPIRLRRRSLDILCALASANGGLVSKDELMERVWPGRAVEEGNLHVHVSALRRALGENGDGHSYVVTVPGRGYRLAGLGGFELAGLDPLNQIRDKLPYSFEDRGEQSVKNLARPVRVDALGPEAVADLPVPSVPSAPPISQPAVAPRLSIVVLPFTNLGNDPEQQYFADGITEDLTTDLSRLTGMLVISRNTAFTYRNKLVDTKQIGQELCVRYMLVGSVRRSGSQVRVNAQLVDAETDAHLWAERFDRESGDLFALQTEITSRIAVALNLELVGVEAARHSTHPQALDYILRGRNAVELKPPSYDNVAEAIRFFERALALDPTSVEAASFLASTLAGRVLDGMSSCVSADLDRAEALVKSALRTSPRSPIAHFVNGAVLRAQGRPEEATPEYEVAIAFNRNWVEAITALGWCKFFSGRVDEAIPLHEQAIRLSPRDPLIGDSYFRIGRVHLVQSRTEEALPWLEKARSVFPGHPLVHAFLAAAYALLGGIECASMQLSEARRYSGDDRYSSMARLMALGYWGVPKIRALFEATYFAGLRKAGMPEG